MKTAAVIAEYNPFHTGHQFHIAETKKTADAVVAVMSGSFVQRGECAVYSKWQRAASAVRGGADLVLELPTYFALGSSFDFALGAVRLIEALGVVDMLSFGSESGDLPLIRAYADAVTAELSDPASSVRRAVKEGLSYPTAMEQALSRRGTVIPDGANDCLAADYLRALSSVGSDITPYCVPRTNAHDGKTPENGYLSASAIRERIFAGKDVSAFCRLPEEAPLAPDAMMPLIGYAVTRLDPSGYPVRSSADRELISTIRSAPLTGDYTSYLYYIKSKRYTMSRVKRTLLHILLNSGEKIPDFELYARVLALNDTGAALLRKIKKTSDIRIVTKVPKRMAKENPALALDLAATDLRSLAARLPAGQDFLTSPVKL